MTTPRPDQRGVSASKPGAGSMSGAGDLSAALGYPGVPSAVQNCQSASRIGQGAGTPAFFTFSAPGRIWTVVLSYEMNAGPAFSGAGGAAFGVAQVTLNLASTVLAVVELAISNSNQIINGQSEPPIPGLPVVQGETLVLNVNGGNVIGNVGQRASAVVLYSIP